MRSIAMLLLLVFSIACKSTRVTPGTEAPDEIQRPDLSGMKKIEGFFTLYWDNNEGKLWMEVNRLDVEFLYVNSLASGVGSNDIGLDRGQFGDNRVVKFIRNGPKLLLVQVNYGYRAISDNTFEQKAVEESFAQSILWGFDIGGQMPHAYLIDVTEFFLSDAHDVSGALSRTGQGNYQVDLSKSGIFPGNLKSFPQNTEVEAILTFKGKPQGSYVRSVVPTPELITVRQRHSFVMLPDSEYVPRKYDARSGYFEIAYYDYAAPFTEPIEKRYLVRHRLKKKYPDQRISEPVEPIIYYLDPATPEPVRSALLEGASWWEEAFESAGFSKAFRVMILPEDADPMDVRYNIIQWVHRSTRGWSYGHSVIDPRTGEIIKGHVSLGSLRIRQDFLIATGLLSPYYDGSEDVEKAKEMALARIRQLSAHEVGHTLGLAHNYAASAQERASVMDYPHPLIRITDDGEIDLSDAYDTGVGKWDKFAIQYGYAEYHTNEEDSLLQVIYEGLEDGLYFISDKDARPEGSAHPYAHLWDNGKNAADELNRIIAVRKVALDNLGWNSIPENHPASSLEDVFVPVYLMHRYQLEAATKLVGGLFYTYAYKGDGQVVLEMVPADRQRMALKALMTTLQPEFLEIPEPILQLIPPKALAYANTREHFRKRTGVTFDPLTVAESAADMTLRLLLHPERASRLVDFKSRDQRLPGLSEVLDLLIQSTWKDQPAPIREAEINRTVSQLLLTHLTRLAQDETASVQARAITLAALYDLEEWMQTSLKKVKDPDQQAHLLFGLEQMRRFKAHPEDFSPVRPLPLPMGSPIGNLMDHCDF